MILDTVMGLSDSARKVCFDACNPEEFKKLFEDMDKDAEESLKRAENMVRFLEKIKKDLQ